MRYGFSLIELLVVVAIIGVLAGVGGFAYLAYVDGVKSDRLISETQQLARAVDQDITAIASGMQGDTMGFSASRSTTCFDYVNSLVGQLNSERQNIFNAEASYAVNGHCLVNRAESESSIPRVAMGQVSVSCADPDQALNQRVAESAGDAFNVSICACQNDGCTYESSQSGLSCPKPQSVSNGC